jgi:hypothetical protein
MATFSLILLTWAYNELSDRVDEQADADEEAQQAKKIAELKEAHQAKKIAELEEAHQAKKIAELEEKYAELMWAYKELSVIVDEQVASASDARLEFLYFRSLCSVQVEVIAKLKEENAELEKDKAELEGKLDYVVCCECHGNVISELDTEMCDITCHACSNRFNHYH